MKSTHGNLLTSPRHVKKSKNGFGRYKSSKSGLRKRGRPPKIAIKIIGGKETNEMETCETEIHDNENGDLDSEDAEKDNTENSLKETNPESNLLDCLDASSHILDANNNIKDMRSGNPTLENENEEKLHTKSDNLNVVKTEIEYNTVNGNGNGNGNGNQNGNQKPDEILKRKNSSVHFDPVKNFIL